MQAVVQPAFGLPEILRIDTVERPALREDGVLVRVVAAGVTKGDWHLLLGKPYLIRAAGYGFSQPRQPIPGMAIAGRVEAVGPKVTAFAVGDEVFGEVNRGAYAEYICVGEDELARKPAGLSFEEAATIPVSATTALQALRDGGALQAGQHVLINGAAGGVGTYAVQLAKTMGAVVTGVCSARNVELVRGLGADHVLDYGAVDFTTGDTRYDLILDLVGNQPLAHLRRVLTPAGRVLASAGGIEHEWTGPLFAVLGGMLSNAWSAQRFVPVVAKPNKGDLATVGALVADGKVRAVIDRRYTLAEVPEALRYLGEGRTRGKSVVTV